MAQNAKEHLKTLKDQSLKEIEKEGNKRHKKQRLREKFLSKKAQKQKVKKIAIKRHRVKKCIGGVHIFLKRII